MTDEKSKDILTPLLKDAVHCNFFYATSLGGIIRIAGCERLDETYTAARFAAVMSVSDALALSGMLKELVDRTNNSVNEAEANRDRRSAKEVERDDLKRRLAELEEKDWDK